MKSVRFFGILICLCWSVITQAQRFTHADTLRGSNGPFRKNWNVRHYDVHARFNLADSSISGFNDLVYSNNTSKENTTLQIDLQEPMQIDSAFVILPQQRLKLTYTRSGNVWMLKWPKKYPVLTKINNNSRLLRIYYHGHPRIARKAPWDGGLVTRKDKQNRPWATIACQGLGASVWYPCKDIQSDEPDSAAMHITVADSLVVVGNGRLRSKINNNDGTATYHWAVVNPINNYCLIPYIGYYVHFGEVFPGEKGPLDMDYWVIDYNLEKAKKQFEDAPRMMKAFEYWFGPYPFYEDGYKLVDAPHLGMEHQSAIAYGNGYMNGYSGMDLSGSGWGKKWDFIIVHESGHEWFANNISTNDIADMWVHEGFTNYSETLFTDYHYGNSAGDAYVQGIRKNIANDEPVIAPYGVNKEGSGDMYYKGANMIHMIRQVMNNDSLFRQLLRDLNKTFYHQTVTSRQIEQFIIQQTHVNFQPLFDQYLRTVQIPVLEYKLKNNQLAYRFSNCIKGFRLPVKVGYNGSTWLQPTEQWQTLASNGTPDQALALDPNFYIRTKKVD